MGIRGLAAVAFVACASFAQAQTVNGMTAPPTEAVLLPSRTPLEEEMRHELVCLCGTCGHRSLTNCPCASAETMRGQLAEQIKLGKTRDEIREYFIRTYGSEEPLGAPIDKGFNRLAWLVPYLVAATGAAGLGFAAIRLSRRPPAPTEAVARVDPDLDHRLDDELSNLD